MLQRVELDPDLPPVRMPGAVLAELYAHAREAYPEECCGLLSGRTAQHSHVYRCENQMTRQHQLDPVRFPRDAREGFYMNPLDYQAAEKDALGRGERVTGVYHSHPGFAVYLSELDLEFALAPLFPFPDADQVVISVVDGRIGGVGLFEPDPRGGFRAGRTVVALETP